MGVPLLLLQKRKLSRRWEVGYRLGKKTITKKYEPKYYHLGKKDYDEEMRAKIARNAGGHGNKAAVSKFLVKPGKPLAESTSRNMKKCWYLMPSAC